MLEIDNYTPVLTVRESIVNRIDEFEAEERVIELISDDNEGSAQDSTPGSSEETASEQNIGKKQKPKKRFFVGMFAGTGVLGKSVKSWDVYVHFFDVKYKSKAKRPSQ